MLQTVVSVDFEQELWVSFLGQDMSELVQQPL